jgi:hypothetical protein
MPHLLVVFEGRGGVTIQDAAMLGLLPFCELLMYLQEEEGSIGSYVSRVISGSTVSQSSVLMYR